MIVWKTDDEQQIAKFEEWKAQRQAHIDAACALAAEVTGHSAYLGRGGSFVGLPWDGGGDVPAGWKVSDVPIGVRMSKDCIVPDRRLKAGKEWAKRVTALPPMSRRAACDGQPVCVFHRAPTGLSLMHAPQFHRFSDNGPLYMIWNCNCDEASMRDEDSIAKGVDATIWQPVKLSEFYAEVEAEKERMA